MAKSLDHTPKLWYTSHVTEQHSLKAIRLRKDSVCSQSPSINNGISLSRDLHRHLCCLLGTIIKHDFWHVLIGKFLRESSCKHSCCLFVLELLRAIPRVAASNLCYSFSPAVRDMFINQWYGEYAANSVTNASGLDFRERLRYLCLIVICGWHHTY